MRALVFLCLPLILSGGNSYRAEEKWTSLFNGRNLKGWNTYLGPIYDSLQKKRTNEFYGLNNDPAGVFTVVNEDGMSAIRISGEHFGGISTQKEFSNYHLKLEFKWGEKKWAPRKNQKRDSGLLYHAVGPHGADGGFWMRSQELQIQEGDCGDYWGVAGGVVDIPARKDEKGNYVYDAAAQRLTFAANTDVGRRCIKNPDAEKPTGEWNTIDLYCYEGTSVHIVNGVVVMALYNSRQFHNGKEVPLTKGKIQIQSEGAEVFYRNILIRKLRGNSFRDLSAKVKSFFNSQVSSPASGTIRESQ